MQWTDGSGAICEFECHYGVLRFSKSRIGSAMKYRTPESNVAWKGSGVWRSNYAWHLQIVPLRKLFQTQPNASKLVVGTARDG